MKREATDTKDDSSPWAPTHSGKMLKKTLGIIVNACRDAISNACGLEIVDQNIIQVPERAHTFAEMASVRGIHAPVHDLHFACDQQMSQALASGATAAKSFAALSEAFYEKLSNEVALISRRGHFARQPAESPTCHQRGIRSFSFEIATEMGRIFVVADLASQLEIGKSKGGDFEIGITNAHMRGDFLNLSELTSGRDIDSLMIVLRKLEADINLELLEGGRTTNVFSGVLMEQAKQNNQRVIRMSWDWPDQESFAISANSEVKASFGILGRLFQFKTPVVGIEMSYLDDDVGLPCALLAMPKAIVTSQRRQSFRLEPTSRVIVEIETAPPDLEMDAQPPRKSKRKQPPKDIVRATVADISFGGAKLVAPRDELMQKFAIDQVVRCTFRFPGVEEGKILYGTVNRLRTFFGSRNTWLDDLGLEFLIDHQPNKPALDYIQQFILSEQRRVLAKRVTVTTS